MLFRSLNNGISDAKGEFILCLNDDVLLSAAFIENALKGFDINDKVGMVSGKILRFDKKTIDSTELFLTPWRTAKERGYGIKDVGQFEKNGYVFGVSGAVAFYRRKMLKDIKKMGTVLKGWDSPHFFEYFDSRFGFFYEDLDVAWRAQRMGWKGYYVPSAIAYHLRGGTARVSEGKGKPLARHYISDELHACLIKNRYRTIAKNETMLGFLLHLPFILLYDMLVWFYVLSFKRGVIKCLRATERSFGR